MLRHQLNLKHAERLTKPNAELRKRLAVQQLAQLKIEQEQEGAHLMEMQAQTAQVPQYILNRALIEP